MEIINLDMTPSTVTPNAHAGQYDSARTVRFMLKNGGVPFTLAGTETITAEITRSDNTEVTANVENTSSNYVDVVFDDTVCTVKGLYACELRLKDSDGFDIGSKNFALLVQRDPYDGKNVRVVTVGPADICTFSTDLPEPLRSVIVDVVATGGNGTPENPNPINGYTEANIVNTQNESIVDLFSIDSDFRGTVVFNQLVKNGNFESRSEWSTSNGNLTVNNNIAHFTATATDGRFNQTLSLLASHKYLISGAIKTTTATDKVIFSGIATFRVTPSTEWQPFSMIINRTTSGNGYYIILDGRTSDWDEIQVKNAMVIDLTQMFGSTIADYIYTLEQNNAGAGVAFFRSIYPEDYYAYDSGTTEIVGKETPEATIAFGQTVYGGVLDVTRGKLTVTWNDIDLSSLNYERNTVGDYVVFRGNISDKAINTHSLCSDYVNSEKPRDQLNNNEYGTWNLASSMNNIVIRDDSKANMSASDFKTSMSGVILAYELATPFDIDLTPEVISAIVGTNNVFADCGETTVKYLTVE